MDAIYKRRSIRRFKSGPVDEKTLVSFVKAGMNAPSAGNQRLWRFVIITERSILDEIPSVHPYSSMLKEAPAAILVCGDMDLEEREGYWVQDCAAATQNILLEIADRGYGGCWLGVYPREDRVEGLRRLLNIPGHIIPLSLIAVGIPAEKKPPKNEFDKSRITFNRW
ncbi:MAG: nitroreductase family protein [Spirochaetes bacterium]|nr:nitroreductase family protein [Spirochaetota bacterium]